MTFSCQANGLKGRRGVCWNSPVPLRGVRIPNVSFNMSCDGFFAVAGEFQMPLPKMLNGVQAPMARLVMHRHLWHPYYHQHVC